LGEEAIPHITLYNPEIPCDNYDTAVTRIETLSHDIRRITIPFDKYAPAPKEDTGFFVTYKQTKELQQMRKAVIDVVNPIRDGVVRAKWEGNTDFACEIDKYGYPLSQYHFPHITLAKFTSQETLDKALEEMQEVEVGDFEARSIAVVETGEHGTAKRIVKEFVLE
jgi:2'-5' RNA ligase